MFSHAIMFDKIELLTLAFILVGDGEGSPISFLRAGSTKRLKHTMDDTGLPVK